MQWHRHTIQEIFAELGSSQKGLTTEEAERRLAQYGPNQLTEEEGVNLLAIAMNQVKSPLIFILAVAGVVTLSLSEYIDSGVIFAVILLNGVIGFVQELKAEKSVRSLKKLVNPKAHVLRDGKEREVDSRTLVPGDVVFLVSGSMAPADLRMFSATELKIDESMLTGESIPVEKSIDPIVTDEHLTPGDKVNMGFMGSIVVSGRGKAVVVETGAATELGGIAQDMQDVGVVQAPIQQKIHRFAQIIGLIVLGSAGLLFGLGIFVGEPVKEMFMTAVAAAVATVPEGLPIVVTIAMAVGVARMARHNAIIRKLPAVETLGSTTVICSDKTGTLTVNEMTVKRAYDGRHDWELDGEGYEPEGGVRAFTEGGPKELQSMDQEDLESLQTMMRVGLLCNESRLMYEDEAWRVDGDPTEGALIVSARKTGMTRDSERESWPELDMLPFESDRGYMATLHQHGDRKIMFVKGGPDRLLELCQTCTYQQGINAGEIRDKAAEWAREGLRVLAFAVREMPADSEHITDTDATDRLVFVGLQGMIDPPRPQAIEAIKGCRRAGITVKMITGDHADTAKAISRKLGLTDEHDEVVTGGMLHSMSDAQLAEKVKTVNVFARIAPSQKYRIVEALKEQGEIVAVTGDGVNDAPALKASHIGVAMGKNGTDVAREAADMVLVDDNFSSIYSAVREGRIVFENLRKVTFFLIPTGIAAVWSILASVLMGIPIPYVPAQLLWINLVTNGLQDVALAFEPGEPGVENKPPRPPKEGVMNRRLVERTLIVSILIAIGVVYIFTYAMNQGYSLEKARTMAVTTMVFFQFFQAWNARSELKSVFRLSPFSNKFLFISMFLAVLAQVTVVYSPALQWVFRTEALALYDWVKIIAMSASVIVLVELDKFVRRQRS